MTCEEKAFIIIDPSTDEYTIKIKEKARKEGRKKGMEEGMKEGIKKGEENIIKQLLKTMTPKEISQKTRYSLETINQIHKNHPTTKTSK